MEENIGTMIAQVSKLMRRSFDERARGIGVTRSQWQVLTVLSFNEGINQCKLADILEVEPITAGRMIDRLQEAALVQRRPDPCDRRAWLLFITPHGRELVEQLRPLGLETLDQALDGISDADRAALMEMMERIRANLARRVVVKPLPESV